MDGTDRICAEVPGSPLAKCDSGLAPIATRNAFTRLSIKRLPEHGGAAGPVARAEGARGRRNGRVQHAAARVKQKRVEILSKRLQMDALSVEAQADEDTVREIEQFMDFADESVARLPRGVRVR
jgi:hypothetical protein